MLDYLFYLLLLAPKVAKRCRGEPCSPTDTPCTSPLQTSPPKSQGGEAYVSLCLYRLSIVFFVKFHLYGCRGRRPRRPVAGGCGHPPLRCFGLPFLIFSWSYAEMGFEDSVKVTDTSEACLISNIAYGNIFLFHKFFGIINPQGIHNITET